jgi:hypothetical protein
MAGFIRRYGYSPGVETITLIEGVIIVDLPPPGAINGVSSGTVGLAGEFPDMTYATAVDSAGLVTTNVRPVEVTSGQDMLDKVGGWDATLGDFGNTGGSGFEAVRNKTFTRLILAPVNLASAAAGRAWRDLPTNQSATVATPSVTLQGGRVEAGREFISGVNKVRLGKRINFTALGHYKNAIDGAVTSGAPALFQTFNSATGNFLTAFNGGPVPKGHILVLGQVGGAGALGANAFTYRVTTTAVSATALVVEKMDAASFDWTTGTALPYRLHQGSDADSGFATPSKLTDPAGYTLPCRPTVALIAAATSLSPTTVPPAVTASSWDVLSGLTLRSHVTAGFAYTANLQQPNTPYTAGVNAAIDAAYITAIDSMLQDVAPARDINIVFSARTSPSDASPQGLIRAQLKTHVLNASAVGLGRTACTAPDLRTVSASIATGDSSPGVGAQRHERVIYDWPGAQTFVPEAVDITLGTADGLNTTDGILDTRADGWLAAVLSNLPPERNPGQSGPPVDAVLAPILGLQRGLSALKMGDYINMRAAGICGLRMDKTVGPIFQSGITTSLVSGQKNIARRRMADFIQDSVSKSIIHFAKQPLTTKLKDDIVGEIDAFLTILQSPSNPPAQRIVGYVIDDKSGNTPELEAKGIFVVIGRVRTLASADFIVFQTEIGEGVVITTA